MTPELILYIGRRTLEVALLISAPVLGVALAAGLLAALLQAVTSIRDMTLGMVVKIVAVGVTVLLAGGWMLQVLVSFSAEIFNHMQSVTR
jgi:flagellar biosynthetic protein FliQ